MSQTAQVNEADKLFVSLYNAAERLRTEGRPFDEVIAAYDRASKEAPTRAEALHGASRLCRENKKFAEGYDYARRGLAVPMPANGLFVVSWIYQYGLLDEFAVNAYWTERYQDCLEACRRLLREGKMPAGMHDRIKKNIEFATEKINMKGGYKSVWSYRFDYPINAEPRWGYGRPSHPGMLDLLESQIKQYTELLETFHQLQQEFSSIGEMPSKITEPCWNNNYFSSLDAAALMSLIALRTPRQYVEIGSGYSTKFARQIITSRSLSTKVISVDPNPRSEIDSLCDQIIRQPIETVGPPFFDMLGSGDILFFDGSHRIFQNSDVVAFFYDVLPRLKSGVLVHVHDIFWPDDYPPEWKWRHYSEQYLLGALMLWGTMKFRILLPNFFVSRHPSTAPLIEGLGIPPTYPSSMNNSFWFEVL